MTGFGHAETNAIVGQLFVEVKGYNSRYLDLSINLPSSLLNLEAIVRQEILSHVKRGRVEVNIRWYRGDQEPLNYRAIESFKLVLKQLKEHDIEPHYYMNDLKEWAFFGTENSSIMSESFFMMTLKQALDHFLHFRSKEGATLLLDIKSQLNTIKSVLDRIEELAPLADEMIIQRLRMRFKEVLGNEIEEHRLLEEIALYLVKININEEITRMRSHLSAMESLLKGGEPMGRRIDFVSQELNREVNTMGAKTPLIDIQQLNITLKESIEKIREQARNVE